MRVIKSFYQNEHREKFHLSNYGNEVSIIQANRKRKAEARIDSWRKSFLVTLAFGLAPARHDKESWRARVYTQTNGEAQGGGQTRARKLYSKIQLQTVSQGDIA